MRSTLVVILLLEWSMFYLATSLLFPASSVFQITSAVSAPVLIPGRKLYWDWGLQMNYNLPNSLQQFINVPIWPAKWERNARELVDRQVNHSLWDATEKYRDEGLAAGRHPSDFTAGEMYLAMENMMPSFGYHETCLLRTVCELAAHPFAEDKTNILIEVLTYVLTPSMHEAFSETEAIYRSVYEQAELWGYLGRNCTLLYPECERDLLNTITKVITAA